MNVGARRLSEALLRPIDMYGPGRCDEYLSGFMNQVSQAVDDSISQEVCVYLRDFWCVIFCHSEVSSMQIIVRFLSLYASTDSMTTGKTS